MEKHKGFWIVDGTKIHGFDLVEPGGQFTVANFLEVASASLFRISAAKKLPIIVGGTGFYMKALIDGIGSIGVPSDMKLRNRLEKLSVDQLYQKLEKINLNRAKAMNESDRKNPRRLIRAIEVATYKKKSSFAHEVSEDKQEATHYSLPTTNYLLFGLTAPNGYLYTRADLWLETRLKHGMVREVESLIKQGISTRWLDDLGLEYRWIVRYLKKEVDYDQMVEKLKGDIHSFIRRQKTWFRKFRQMQLFDISKSDYQKRIEKVIND